MVMSFCWQGSVALLLAMAMAMAVAVAVAVVCGLGQEPRL